MIVKWHVALDKFRKCEGNKKAQKNIVEIIL